MIVAYRCKAPEDARELLWLEFAHSGDRNHRKHSKELLLLYTGSAEGPCCICQLLTVCSLRQRRYSCSNSMEELSIMLLCSCKCPGRHYQASKREICSVPQDYHCSRCEEPLRVVAESRIHRAQLCKG